MPCRRCGNWRATTRWPAWTTFGGLYQRAKEHDFAEPFGLPKSWTERKSRLDMATPINFVCTADIIGGNSGSPVINAKGEVVGLIFDGNIEQLPTRFVYNDNVERSVAVHTAGITEALKKVYGASRLATELTAAAAKK